MTMKSRKCSYSLSICTDMYLLNAKTFSPQYNKDMRKYELAQDVELKYVIRTDSKSELKIKMAVYGFRFGKMFKLYRSAYGRYAELEVVPIC